MARKIKGPLVDLHKGDLPELPVIPVRDSVLFPRLVTPLFVGRERGLRALEAASGPEKAVIVLAQREPEIDEPTPEQLYPMGTLVVIGRSLRMPDGTSSIVCQGRARVRIVEFTQDEPYLKAKVMAIPEAAEKSPKIEALMRAVLALFEKVVRLSENLPEDAYVAAMNADEPGWLADLVASLLHLDLEELQQVLEILEPVERLEHISLLLAKELDVLELQNKIHAQVQEEVEKSQREYYLREQMRVIQTELGESSALDREMDELTEKIEAAGMLEEAREKATKELERLSEMPPGSPEIGMVRAYLDWLVELPWTKATRDNMDIRRAARILEKNHYGLDKAKERILEHMAVRKLARERMRQPILCFVGPPGTGKTSLGQSIAQALGRSFVRVSLGGVRDEAEIRGHRRTYIGSLPGRILQTMRRAGTVNPVFMLDELDKIGLDFRGDPSAALLEVLDPEQNHAFLDHYLDVPYDLSKVLFITTANILDTAPPALEDRLEVIRFPGYIEEEKVRIATHFLIPRQLREHGLKNLQFSTGAIQGIIRDYTDEAGVRNLDREIATICRKLARRVAEGRKAQARITRQGLGRYLGPRRHSLTDMEGQDEVGVATGISVTEAGGDLLFVEVNLMEGKGSLSLTGQLGDVMQESAQAALSYVRANVKLLGLRGVDFDKLDIHVHVPEGAVPKEGPSAGITIATALISALLEKPVHRDVGMTGEITLRGRVLPIGGFKEKVLAAHRAGLRTILLPSKNEQDLVEIPSRIKRDLKFVFVERMDQVLPVALVTPEPGPQPGSQPRSRPSRRTKR